VLATHATAVERSPAGAAKTLCLGFLGWKKLLEIFLLIDGVHADNYQRAVIVSFTNTNS
jgi:hypothetical protein